MGQNTPSATDGSGQGATRAERLKQMRREKAKTVAPAESNRLEETLLWMENSGFLSINYKGFFPKFSAVSRGAGLSPGVRYWNPDIGTTRLDIEGSAAVSLTNYQLFDLQFGSFSSRATERLAASEGIIGIRPGDVNIIPDKFFWYGDLRYRSRTQEDFYGLGPDSTTENESEYKINDTAVEAVAGYHFNRWVGAAVRTGLLNFEVSRGTDSGTVDVQDLFDEQSAPGLTVDSDFFHFESALFLDFRDRPGSPHQGGILTVSFERFDDTDGDAFDFNRYSIDGRHFIPLGSEQRVLALHAFGSTDETADGARVPFYLQNFIGGTGSLRGFENFRFRDTNVLYLSAEYRWEAASAFELAFFYDAGKVFADRADFDFTGLRKSVGVGARFKTAAGVFIRIEAARSQEGNRFIFTFGPSF